ncbi:MAG: dihydroorotate dehydrogenase electron transfer subunit [Lachnospiraceae bacterium]|nr:dihydroorotate dehydrogenase electron transfer subunit [Lachnospiraceae bacterium]
MGKKEQMTAVITEQVCMTGDIYQMRIKAERIAAQAKAGQFVSLYCKEGGRLLPRPISICEIDREKGELRFVYRIVGAGTKEFSSLAAGEHIVVTGPLGNGFMTEDCTEGMHAVLLGGGIGIPPMLELAKALPGEKTIVLGYRDADTFLAKEFEPYGRVVLASDNGSAGVKGTVLDALRKEGIKGDMLFACGPKPMLRGIKEYAKEQGLRAQLSLEERMACGIGACLACVCKTTETDGHSQVKNARVCKEGPVFYAEEIEL